MTSDGVFSRVYVIEIRQTLRLNSSHSNETLQVDRGFLFFSNQKNDDKSLLGSELFSSLLY
jgi:hypothetical protein